MKKKNNIRKNKIWGKENCINETLKYDNMKDFGKKSASCYNTCLKNKWLDELTKHMKLSRKPNNYWTKERCQEEALKYNNRKDFNKYSLSSYCKSWDKGWLDEICSHMNIIGNKFKRCIYAYEFKNEKVVYVGLTYNIEKRNGQHLKRGPVFKFSYDNEIKPMLIKLTDYLDIEQAKIMEEYYLKYYINLNWKVLNKMKTGAIGGNTIMWTKELCISEAKKCETIKEYRKNLSYRAACRNKWLDDVYKECGFVKKDKKPNKYWTIEKCKETFENCSSLKEFKKTVVHDICRRHMWNFYQ